MLENDRTTTKSISIRTRRQIDEPPIKPAPTPEADLAEESIFGKRAPLFDQLARNVAVLAAIVLVLTALARANEGTPAKAVFSALQDSVSMEWDESLGKLTFVDNLLPEAVREVWSEREAVSLCLPLQGELVSAFSHSKPYIEILSASDEVHAALSGEMMAVAHGPDEELIVRVRHDNGMESIYGNLRQCFFSEGDQINEGDVIGQTVDGGALSFELRRAGIPIDPTGLFGEPVT